MANPHRGEVSFDLDGQTYTLSFSANALCELEDLLNLGVNEITVRLSQSDKVRIKTVRAVFWAALTDHHPDITVKDAGVLLTRLTVAKAIDLIAQAFSRAFPDQEAKEAEASSPRPPLPDRVSDGTGRAS